MVRRNTKLADTLSSTIHRQSQALANLNHELTAIAEESLQAAEVLNNSSAIIDELEYDFEQTTKLQKKDIAFLFIATGLQCLRQYVIPPSALRLSASEGDRLMAKIVPKPWQDILCASVPYDAITTSADFKNILLNGTDLGGTTHRVRTLGHDPMFGWIFGTANIISDSLTKTDFITTYSVNSMVITGSYTGGTIGMLNDCLAQIQAEKMLLPIAVLRQAIHYGSDVFTKQGLPLPLKGCLNNNFALTLTNKFGIDTYGTFRSAALSAFINLIISYAHTLFYNQDQDGTESAYEVRTRKIVSYSNIIATSSNILYTALNYAVGNTAALKKFDFGGLLVTIYRLLTDRKKIYEIKKEFLNNEFYKRVNC